MMHEPADWWTRLKSKVKKAAFFSCQQEELRAGEINKENDLPSASWLLYCRMH